MACLHDDCFSCPYPDCISKDEPKKKKPGRKKLPPEVVHQHRIEYQRRYNEEHREEIYAKMKAYYQEHKEEYRARERRNRQRKKEG